MVEGVECSQKERSCIDGDGRMSAEFIGPTCLSCHLEFAYSISPFSRRNVQHWIRFCCSPVISVLFYKVARLFHSARPFPCVWSQQLGHSITAWYLYIVWLGCANSRPILSPLPPPPPPRCREIRILAHGFNLQSLPRRRVKWPRFRTSRVLQDASWRFLKSLRYLLLSAAVWYWAWV